MSLANHDLALVRIPGRPGVWNIKVDDVLYTEEVGVNENIIAKIANLVYRIETVQIIRDNLDNGIF